MNIFAGIWAKITLALSLIIGVLFIRGKYQSNKIEGLEHENTTLIKKNEIKTQAAIDTAQVISDEQNIVLNMIKETKSNDKKIGVDNINSL